MLFVAFLGRTTGASFSFLPQKKTNSFAFEVNAVTHAKKKFKALEKRKSPAWISLLGAEMG